MTGVEYEYESKKDPQGEFSEVRKNIASDLRDAITDGLNKRIKKQSPDGIEPEMNGMSALIIDMAGQDSTQKVKINDHVFTVHISVAPLKPKTQEGPTGSDIAVFLEVRGRNGDRKAFVSKTLLIQAKVGRVNKDKSISAGDKHLPMQIKQIQRISPDDGFLLIYTDRGAYCVSISEASNCLKGKTVRTKNYSNAGDMIYQMVMCTAGNARHISPTILQPARDGNGNILVMDAADKLANKAATAAFDEAISISFVF